MVSTTKYSPFLDMNRDEAYDLMKECVKEIQKRLVINLPNFEVSHYKSIIRHPSGEMISFYFYMYYKVNLPLLQLL